MAVSEKIDRGMQERKQKPNSTKRKKKMNTDRMINSLYENLNAVQVVFGDDDRTPSNEYTYKTFEEFEVGDFCIVHTPREGLTVAKVVGTDSSRLEEDYRFKWIVGKVDLAGYNDRVKKEHMAIEALSREIRLKNRQESIDKVKELVGDDATLLIAGELNKALEN